MQKAVLAYSGGLDTSVTIRWLIEQGYEVHAVAVDVGQQEDFAQIVARGETAGAASVRVVDAVDRYAAEFLTHAIKTNALYEGKYPMVSGLARPCIVEEVVKVARELGAETVAHGCTGKGNDQVRFEVGFYVLAPDLQVLAPIRDAGIPREKALALAAEWGIPVGAIVSSYSIDENLWGRTAECGPLEDPWVAPPEDAFARTRAEAGRPNEPAEIAITFDRGIPVALDGETKTLPEIVRTLDGLARVDETLAMFAPPAEPATTPLEEVAVGTIPPTDVVLLEEVIEPVDASAPDELLTDVAVTIETAPVPDVGDGA